MENHHSDTLFIEAVESASQFLNSQPKYFSYLMLKQIGTLHPNQPLLVYKKIPDIKMNSNHRIFLEVQVPKNLKSTVDSLFANCNERMLNPQQDNLVSLFSPANLIQYHHIFIYDKKPSSSMHMINFLVKDAYLKARQITTLENRITDLDNHIVSGDSLIAALGISLFNFILWYKDPTLTKILMVCEAAGVFYQAYQHQARISELTKNKHSLFAAHSQLAYQYREQPLLDETFYNEKLKNNNGR